MSFKTVFAEKEQARRQEQQAVLQAFKDQTAESARLAAAHRGVFTACGSVHSS